MKLKLFMALFLFCPLPGLSQETPQIDYETARLERVIDAVRISENISIDGTLEEPVWKLAMPATDFIAQSPRPGFPAQERTEVRVLYDDNNLYVGAYNYHSNVDDIVINELTEDFNFGQSDAITIVLDTLHDRRSAFMFIANPAGARRDIQVGNDGEANNPDWDGLWDVKTQRTSDGWTAEFQIPFTTLRFTTAETQEWGFNVTRAMRGLNEESHWSPLPVRYRASKVSYAGTLRGIENISQGMNLKVKPFALAGVTQTRIDGQMETTRSLTRLKDYDGGVDAKYSLTPSLTLDATYRTDFAQVEADQQQVNLTRFSLFFPEKRDFFLENSGTFNFGPQNSNLLPFFSRRIGLSSAGTPIPIVGGARVSGQIGSYDVGFLGMKTERLNPTIPSNNYLVGRVKRNLMRNSWVGGIVTNRDSSTEGDYNRVFGSDAHFQFNRLEFDAYLLGSDTPGRTGNSQAQHLQTAWRDDELTINLERNAVQTNFNPEVGFIRRRDMTQSMGEFFYRPQFTSNPRVRNLTFGTKLDYYEAPNGKIETREHESTLGLDFKNNARADFRVTNTFDRLGTPTKIQGIELPAGDYHYRDYSIGLNSNPSTKIIGNGSYNWGEFWNGHRRSFNGSLGLKPNYHLNVTMNYNRNRVELLNTVATTDLVGARFSYGFNPRAFLNAFFQYNTETHEVSSNIRFNITYRPLSDLYIVYNDRRNTTSGLPLERAFIVKLTRLVSF